MILGLRASHPNTLRRIELRGVASRETRHLVAVPADGHGAPASAVGPRVIAEKEAAHGIGTNAHARLRAFHYDFGRRARDGRQQPIETTLSSYEFQFPPTACGDQFVMPLGNAQDSVDR